MNVKLRVGKRFPRDAHPYFITHSHPYVQLRKGEPIEIPDEVYEALSEKLEKVPEGKVKKPVETKVIKSPSIEEAPEKKKKVADLLHTLET